MDHLAVGQRVYYVDSEGRQRRATVEHIHYDQHPPYFTIKLLHQQREIQTEASRIRVRGKDQRSTVPVPLQSSE